MASILVPMDASKRMCTACGKEFERDILLVKDGDLCPECRKVYGGMAFVFCNTCQKVVSRVTPGTTSSGFFVKPGDLLHVKACPVCTPGIQESVIEEQLAYEKGR